MSVERTAATCVSPGVWATKVPFPGFLGYSFSYSVRVPEGLILVDLGWDSDDGWATLEFGLTRARASWDDVIGVVITHAHPDHFGLADRVRFRSSAWIAGHRAEAANVVAGDGRQTHREVEVRSWLRMCGVPEDTLDLMGRDALSVVGDEKSAFDLLLEDDDFIPGSNDTLVTVHTPGHTAGSVCVLDTGRRLLFTGDHLLPRVTPNISKRPGSAEDPVADHANALMRIGSLGDDLLILPGHEWAFDQPAHRIAELHGHSQERGRESLAALAAGATTVWEVAQATALSRPFNSLDVRGRRQALGETHAHLHHLGVLGEVEAQDGSPARWMIASRQVR